MKMKHVLTKNGRVIFESMKKIDAIFEQQRYNRGQRVQYRAVKI